MPIDQDQPSQDFFRIVIRKDGPYVVYGNIPLVCKVQVVSEFGEPLTWRKTEVLEGGEKYQLCRCGGSHTKPFCDGSHSDIGFDGTETADTDFTAKRQELYPGGTRIVVKRDYSICMDSGFCGNRFTDVQQMVSKTEDTRIRSLAIAMMERCPSGSYTYSIEAGQADIEPDLPRQIAVLTEMTTEGPIISALWVTGNISIQRSDGQPLETRNRVTLCRCGKSKNKPLCDGTHRELHITE
jgi:CDGSH-type Zn-finger protein